ncbi:MAG: ABC transporter ATP-binding protein [Candidatus Dormiibacterota bacterium]
MALIELRDLKKFYGKGDKAVHAIDGVNLDIEKGEFVSIVGRSGSGKTTTLDCLGLLMRPTSGTVTIDGIDTSTLSDAKRADFRSKRVGFIFQGFNLLPSLNAMDNVLLPLRYSGGDKKAARRRAEGLFEEIGMSDRAKHRPAELSGGEQQRVAIARSLINEPALVLGDEPTGEVDTETSQKLIALMRRMNREYGVTFIIVTHDLDLSARTDRVIRLKDGRVIGDEKQTAREEPVAPGGDGVGEKILVG